jgi:hypothetical protein
LYIAADDKLSPFFGTKYSEFEFSQTIYNYYIHPQWDDFGSKTLYLKIIYVDYELHFCVIELIGEWNDAIENDIMMLKREIGDELMKKGISKFIFIAEQVLNFHSSDNEYYREWYDEVSDEEGWIIILNMPAATQQDFIKKKLPYYMELMELPEWRSYKPYHLFTKIDTELRQRIS